MITANDARAISNANSKIGVMHQKSMEEIREKINQSASTGRYLVFYRIPNRFLSVELSQRLLVELNSFGFDVEIMQNSSIGPGVVITLKVSWKINMTDLEKMEAV